MVSLINQAAVNFIGENKYLIGALEGERLGKVGQLLAAHHPAGGIVGRIENDQARASGNFGDDGGNVGIKIMLFRKRVGYRVPSHKVDHRFVNGETRIGINDLVILLNQRQDKKKHD